MRWKFQLQVPLLPGEATYLGFPREHGRGVGTRNYVILLGTTSSYKASLRWPTVVPKRASHCP